MDIHEYQAKALLQRYGVAVPAGGVAASAAQAKRVAGQLPGPDWVVKAQVLAGGRAAAGGVKIVHDPDDVEPLAELMLGARLTTAQTGAGGQTIHQVYVEQGCRIMQAFYLALMVDAELARPVFIASPDSGKGSIEAAARKHPEMVLRLTVDKPSGPEAGALRDFVARTGLDGAAAATACRYLSAMYRLFCDFEASLIEIGPLALLDDGQVVALDAKMSFDDNALFRQPDIRKLRDDCHLSAAQQTAAQHGLNYLQFSGDIGILASGAGLAMATFDAIVENEGAPGVFLDVPPTASPAQVATAFRLLLDDETLCCLVVNVFGGGIMRCDVIADGLLAALQEKTRDMPLVVRLNGINAALAYDKLRACKTMTGTDSLADAARAACQTAAQAAVEVAVKVAVETAAKNTWITPVKRFFGSRSR